MPDHAKQVANVKVVHLEPESLRVAKARIARLPAAVHAIHEKGKYLLMEKLKVFFDRADDSLFELADKAASNHEQNIYFDSMREVRVQRRGFEKRFSIAIDSAFADLATGAIPETPAVDDALSADALSLVQDEDLEEMVAIEASVNRAITEYADQIQQLCLRLDSLVTVKVFHRNNPLGPTILANAFMDQTKRLDIDIKAKLVLFKLFDKTVMHNLGGVYQAINQVLIDHQVLPSLSSAPKQAATPEPSVAAGPQGNDELAKALRGLLNTGASVNPNPAVSELVHLLSVAQQAPLPLGQFKGGISGIALIEEMYRQKGGKPQIGTTEREVINLVDMLFKFILEDRNLSQPMKDIIARMQIPLIKVAVLDKSFFAKGGHAARKLLNEMATAALGWQSSGNDSSDPLYVKMDSIVSTLLNSFHTDVSVFNDLLADFSSFIEKERRRAEVIERRTLDAEDGKARAEVARTVVALEVELRTINELLPAVVSELVEGPWSNVMFVTYLKHGPRSQEWQIVLCTLEDMVWSTQPPKTSDDRKRLIRLVPELLKRLRSGLDSISFNPFQMSEMFKQLEDVHLAAIRGKVQGQAPVPQREHATEAQIDQAKPQHASGGSPTETAEQEREVSAAKPPTQTIAQAENPSVRPEPPEMPAKPLETEEKSESVNAATNDHPYLQQVASFVQGAWFEMKDSDGEVQRCRLAAVIKPTGKYIFVNRNGMKVAEKDKMELAEMLRSDCLRALDNSMLFDRALETVVSSLRKPQ